MPARWYGWISREQIQNKNKNRTADGGLKSEEYLAQISQTGKNGENLRGCAVFLFRIEYIWTKL